MISTIARTVRDMFAQGIVQSAFWHRFALTVHSPVGINPEKYGCRLACDKPNPFANNGIDYTCDNSDLDWDEAGDGLAKATYNYMLGLGYDLPVEKWLPMLRRSRHDTRDDKRNDKRDNKKDNKRYDNRNMAKNRKKEHRNDNHRKSGKR